MPINNIDQIESNFYRALGNGKVAAVALGLMMEAVVISRDTTVLCRAMKRAAGKDDEAAAQVVGFVAKCIWPGAKLSKADTGFSIKIKGIDADPAVVENLNKAVERGYSIRNATFRKAVELGFDEDGKVNEKAKAEFDAASAASKFAKAHTTAELEAFIAALQGVRGTTSDAVVEPTAEPALTDAQQELVTDAE